VIKKSKFRCEGDIMSLVIKDGFIVTMDKERRIIPEGTIVVEGNKIVDIGPTKEMEEKYSFDKVIDAKKKLVLPGFICGHSHMAYTLGHNMPVDMRQFKSFIEMLTKWAWPAIEDPTTKDDVYYAGRFVAAKMLKSGTTTTHELVEGPYHVNGILDGAAKAVEESGMRAIIAFETTERVSMENAKEGIKENLRFIQKWNNVPDTRIRGRFGVHTVFTASPETLKEVRELATKHKAGIHIHVAESTYEIDYIKEKYGKTPVEHMRDLGFLGPDVVTVHDIHLTDNDLKIYKEYDTKVIHTPMSNMLGAAGVAKIPQMLDLGITVGLGHDCFFTLDMTEYMRAAFLLHKIANLNPLLIAPFQVLEMVTINGARAIGLENEIGSIEVGKKADIIVVNERFPTPLVPDYMTIASAIVNDMNGADVETVIVDGKVVVENKQLLTIDENDAYEKAKERTSMLWEKNGIKF